MSVCVKHLLLKMALNCKISNSFSRAIHMTSISFPLRRMGLRRAVAFHFIVCTISLVGRFGGTKKIRHTYTRHTNTQCICSTLYLMTINMYYPISPFWLARTIRWLKKPNQFFQLITMVYATHTLLCICTPHSMNAIKLIDTQKRKSRETESTWTWQKKHDIFGVYDQQCHEISMLQIVFKRSIQRHTRKKKLRIQ